MNVQIPVAERSLRSRSFKSIDQETNAQPIPCRHCGTEFKPSATENEFCCAGCAYVYRLIRQEGLDQFYQLKGAAPTEPVQSRAFEHRDLAWLRDAAKAAETAADAKGPARLDLSLRGASCVGCIWLIERLFQQHEGALQLRIDINRSTIGIVWESGTFDLCAFDEEIQRFGYALAPREENEASGGPQSDLTSKLGVCGALALNAMAFTLPTYLGMPASFPLAGLFQLVAAFSATLSVLVGGAFFFGRAWNAWKLHVLHIDIPIALGIALAYGGSVAGWLAGIEDLVYFDFVAVFTFLMLGGRWLQEMALWKNRRRLDSQEVIPRRIRIFTHEGDRQESLDALVPGCRYEILPGQAIPVTSRMLDQAATVRLDWINGESETRTIPEGGIAASGAIYCGSTPLLVEARGRWAESLLAKLAAPPARSTADHPLLERILRVYLATVLVIGVAGGVGWAIVSGDPSRALQVAISVFVVSCPCALGVAIPLADDLTAARARRLGLFVQCHSFWSRLTKVKKLIFDKTGTLTEDVPALANPEALDDLSARQRQALSRLVRTSAHPLSRSLCEALAARETVPTRGAGESDGQVDEQAGVGLSWIDAEDHHWTLQRASGDGVAATEFREDGQLCASFHFTDAVRSDALTQLAALRAKGYAPYIMSGDDPAKVRRLAEELAFPPTTYRGRMRPEAKAAWVRELDRMDTLYLGDGANDSLAFDRAYCTITPAAARALIQEKADAYFMGRGLNFLSPLFLLAKRRCRAIGRVFGFAVFYNLIAVSVCLAGLMSPLVAAVLMPLSSVLTLGIVGFTFRGADS